VDVTVTVPVGEVTVTNVVDEAAPEPPAPPLTPMVDVSKASDRVE
jgi:hypothetical protein